MKVKYAAPAATILLAAIAAVLFVLLVNDEDEGPSPAATPTPELQTPAPSDVTPTLRPTFTPLPATPTPTPEPPTPTVAPTQPTGTATAAPQPTATTVPLPTPAVDPTPIGGLPPEWQAAAPMLRPRHSHASVTLEDGRVLVIGGQSLSSPAEPLAEIFDPVDGLWTSAGETIVPRDSSVVATRLSDGRVLVVGGGGLLVDINHTEIYDPETNEWIESAPMNIPRSMPGVVVLDDGRVLVVGGVNTEVSNTGSSAFLTYTSGGLAVLQVEDDFHEDTAEIYDPVADAWTLVGSIPEGRVAHSGLAKMADGRVMLVGGDREPAKSTAWVFDPGTEVWEVVEDLPLRTGAASAVTLDDGLTMVAGGRSAGFSPSGSTTVNYYDPGAGSWIAGTEFNDERCGSLAFNMPDDPRVMLTWTDAPGWCTFGITAARSIEIFDPQSDSWTRFPLPMEFRILGSALMPDGRLLVMGGMHNAANEWNEEASWIFTPPGLN